MSFLPPLALGMPEKFAEWRLNQADAIEASAMSEKRVVIPICPTGFGKSPMYIASAIFRGGRTVILTSTKGLQTQLMNDFAPMGLVDIRGRNAYKCIYADDPTVSCEAGPCIAGVKCPHRDDGTCLYYQALRRAQRAQYVVTNYSYWLYSNAFSPDGLGHVDFLVCDEGHDSPDAVANFLTVELDRTDPIVHLLLPSVPENFTVPQWSTWAHNANQTLLDEMSLLMEKVRFGDSRAGKRLARIKRTQQEFRILAKMQPDNWVVDVSRKRIQFAPIWTSDYAQDVLFGDIPHVMLTSASVCAKTAEMLGINLNDAAVLEYPHSFPVENRLLIHLPTVRMNFKTKNNEILFWLKRIDQIIKPRLDRKGIVHTVSYKRRDMVLSNSQFTDYMMTHATKDAIERVQQFKEASPPRIMVSPSMTTGWDFPYSECEYQIIGKVAYPDTRSKITQARIDSDPEYAPYIAMQQLIQTCGRGVRAADDRCENFIIDDNILWFIKRYKAFAPAWFLESFRKRMAAPMPPPLLNK